MVYRRAGKMIHKNRYLVEPQYELEDYCLCGSCYEPTGKWLVCDINDEQDDVVFETKEEAEEWLKFQSEVKS